MKQRDEIPFAEEQAIRTFLQSPYRMPDQLRSTLVSTLGYKTAPNGVLIWNNIEVTYKFGADQTDMWEDTFESDWETRCAKEDTRREVEQQEADEEFDLANGLQAEEDAVVNPDSAAHTSAREPTEGN